MNKLSHQVIALCIGLVLVTCALVLSSFWWFSSRYTQEHIRITVNGATQVFSQYSSTRAELLSTAAQVLTADYGFKQAVATRDQSTIASALANQAGRIDADLMVISDRNGVLISHTEGSEFDNRSLEGLVASLVQQVGVTVFAESDGRLYQVIALPVRAPVTIAYAIVGFEIDENDARQLKALTELDITFYHDNRVLVSSLAGDTAAIHRNLNEVERSWGFWIRPKFANNQRQIPSVRGQTVSVVLSDDLTGIYYSFDRLVLTTIIIAFAIVALGLVVSILLVNNLTVPLARLAIKVRRFAGGDFNSQIAIKGGSKEIRELLHAYNDMVGEIKNREAHILYQAQHDLLTGLMNRDTLLQAIDLVVKDQQPFYLFALQLRDLQGINDNLGFDAGDACLKEIADRLRRLFGGNLAKHGRLEGDVFLSLAVCPKEVPCAEKLAEILDQLGEPVIFHGLNLYVSFSVGVCRFPEDGNSGKTLVRRTQIALDNARKQGLSVRYYQAGEDEAHMERLSMVEDLKVALNANDGQLFMNYQPKMNLANNRIEKLEALIRWVRPKTGFVPPDIFIELAERAGLILELTHWVIDSVLAQLAAWKQEGIGIQVAINISAQDLMHPEFFDRLQASTQRHGVDARFITLELTERDLMSNEERGVALMQQLRDAGYTLSVDDYGIGQSSLGKLKQLPIHELKIDKSFILKLDESDTDQMIVRSTIDLGHNLGLSVVAEGVENLATQQLLREMGCDYIQGYYLSKPLSVDAVRPWLLDHENPRKHA